MQLYSTLTRNDAVIKQMEKRPRRYKAPRLRTGVQYTLCCYTAL